jgi:hypothetical protein
MINRLISDNSEPHIIYVVVKKYGYVYLLAAVQNEKRKNVHL